MKWVPFCLCLFLLGSSHAGCRGVYRTMERPRITIADATPKEMKRFEHVFDLELRIENPNESALPIKGFAFELEKAPGDIVENLHVSI